MGSLVNAGVPCAKGALCYCLDEFSKGPGARSRVTKLRDAIAELAPAYEGLAEVFDQYLVSHVVDDADQRQRIVAHLKTYWFDSDSQRPFFVGKPVAQIYAEGVLETLDLALKGQRTVVPINAWWVLDSAELKMLNLADVRDGITVGGRVTLLIMTPRPGDYGRATPPWILGDEAEAYVTEQEGGAVTTRRVRDTP
jgi:hypothetical protein